MQFRLLGALEVRDDAGGLISLGGRKPRTLLAVLLLKANTPVGLDVLIDAIWEDSPPERARDSVQYLVHMLRKALAGSDESATSRLQTTASGYQLTLLPADQLDIHQFTELAAKGRAAAGAGRLGDAAELLGRALARWRGNALADFAGRAFAEPDRVRLEEHRLAAMEEHAEALLGLGRHEELIGELEALVQAYPTRERLCRQLMLALYRAGRQADALRIYRTVRGLLADELGIDPSPTLQALERMILTQDPRAAAPGQAVEPESPSPAAALPSSRSPAPAAPQPPGAGGGAGRHTPATHAAAPAGREERRPITAIVAHLPTPTAGEAIGNDPEDALAAAETADEPMREVIERHGGTVAVVYGRRLVAIFGLARLREDDPERAVRAALSLCALPRLAASAQVGVVTGMAIVPADPADPALPGQPLRPGGSALAGRVVDQAALLQSRAATGAVLVSGATYRATRRRITYTAPAVAAGVGGAWQPIAPRSRIGLAVHAPDLGQAVPMVDRARELELLTASFHRARIASEPQLVTLIGEAGLGKTRLVGELGRLVEAEPELTCWRQGSCLLAGGPDGTGRPFGALAEIVTAHAGIADDDPPETVTAKLTMAVAEIVRDRPQRTRLVEQLGMLLGHAAAASESGAPRWRAATAGWASFVAALAADRPLVLVIEDLHAADEALLDFIGSLTDRVDPVPLLIVATARPELLDRRPKWGGGQRNAWTVSLASLSAPGSGRLLAALLDAYQLQVPEATRLRVLRHADGNPLFLEEYARLLRDQPPASPPARPGTPPPLPLPESIGQLIGARIASLAAPDRALLQDLAVAGELGTPALLAVLSDLPVTVEDLQASLARLARGEFLRRTLPWPRDDDTPRYVFRHPLIREVAYGQLLRAERAGKHRRVIAWLQATPSQRPDRTEQLAAHYARALDAAQAAGQPATDLAEPARRAFRAAGDRATSLGALSVAADAYRLALGLAGPPDPNRAEVLFGLGQALAYTVHTGQDVLAEALGGFQEAGDHDRVADCAVLLAQLARMRGDTRVATAYLDQAYAAKHAGAAARMNALGAQALELMIADRHAEAIKAGRAVIAQARGLRLRAAEGTGLLVVGGARLHSGDLDGLPEIRKGIALLAEEHDPTVGFAHFGLPYSLWWYGAVTRTADAVTAARQAIEAGSLVVHWIDALRASVDFAAGRWDDVLAFTDHAVADLGEVLGNILPWCHALRGGVHLGRSQTDAALADADAALARAEAAGNRRYRQAALALNGRALLAAGDRDGAVGSLEALLADQHAHPAQSCARPDLGLLLADLDHPAQALPEGLVPVLWHQAVQAMAERRFAQAAELYQAMGSPADAAEANLRAARHLAATGAVDRARALLARVTAFATTAGADLLLHQAKLQCDQLTL